MSRRYALVAVVILASLTGLSSPCNADGAGWVPEDEPYRAVAFGDSVTKGVRRGVTREQTFEARLEAALRPSFPKVRVLNAGIGGNTVRHAWTRIVQDVVAKRPGFCTIMFAINDSYVDKGRKGPRISIKEYEDRLRSFVRFLRHHAIEPILMTPNPMTSTVRASKREPFASQPKGMNFLLEAYCERMRKVAKEESVPFLDIYAALWKAGGGTEAGVDKWLTDGMHPNPAGHQLIADKLAAFFRGAMPTRATRALPTPRAQENLREATRKLASLTQWKTHALWGAAALPSQSKPRWSAGRTQDIAMAVVQDGEMRFATDLAKGNGALSFTLNLPRHDGALSVAYRAKTSAASKGAPYFSIANGRTKAWTWLFPKRFVVSRFDLGKDRIEIPVDGTVYHTYRVVLAGMDLHVYVDDMTKPVRTAPGWLVPSSDGRYVQFAVTKRRGPCDTYWQKVDIAFAQGE